MQAEGRLLSADRSDRGSKGPREPAAELRGVLVIPPKKTGPEPLGPEPELYKPAPANQGMKGLEIELEILPPLA